MTPTATPELNLEANSLSTANGSPAPAPASQRPMYYEFKPQETVKAAHGTTLRCKTWEAEAALRMLENNLDPAVSLVYDELIVYGGAGRAARNWKEYQTIVKTLKELEADETMLVQSGKAVGVLKTWPHAPRVLIANSNIVPAWSTQEYFDELDKLGLMMYGQMTAGSWIYIATQGILQGTYETFAAMADKHFGGSLRGTITVTAGLGGMSGAQPLAVTMNDGVCLVIEPIDERVKQKVREGYVDEQARDLDHALELCEQAKAAGKGWSVGLTGNAATVLPQLLARDFRAEIVTDQTSAHDLMDYIPEGDIAEVLALRAARPEEFKKQALASIVKHVEAILEMQRRGTIAVDYGNNLRGQAEKGGLTVRDENGHFLYPGFVPGYIRPLFCEGKGPFRWAALSGDPADILRIDRALLETFPENKMLARWIEKAQAKVPFIGLPARVCWLGYGEREKFGLVINDLVARGEVSAPIVIGRDHLDCGSVASPQPRNRRHEGRLRCRGRLAPAQRPGQLRQRCRLGEPAQRRRRGHRQLHPLRHGDSGHRHPRKSRAPAPRAHH